MQHTYVHHHLINASLCICHAAIVSPYVALRVPLSLQRSSTRLMICGVAGQPVNVAVWYMLPS